MRVFPDLEDKVCRLPKNTVDILGIQEGENVTIESTRGDHRIVRGVKAFEIDDERDETKRQQKNLDRYRYPPCEELLGLKQIRRTEVDIPEIWIDQEVRARLGLDELYKSGVCQPVRVYRDTQHLLGQMLHQFAIPLVVVLVAAGLDFLDGRRLIALGLWLAAIIVWVVVLFASSRSRLS